MQSLTPLTNYLNRPYLSFLGEGSNYISFTIPDWDQNNPSKYYTFLVVYSTNERKSSDSYDYTVKSFSWVLRFSPVDRGSNYLVYPYNTTSPIKFNLTSESSDGKSYMLSISDQGTIQNKFMYMFRIY